MASPASRKKKRMHAVTLRLTKEEYQAVLWWSRRWFSRNQESSTIAVTQVVLMALNHAEELDNWTHAHARYCDAEGIWALKHLSDSLAARPPSKRLKTQGKK
jgi:hypothetical protein